MFTGEEVAELELEDFTIENTENAVSRELVQSEIPPEYDNSEPLIAAVDLFANLLDEDESVEDVQGRENSDFVIANSVEDLTLDTEDLFAPEVAESPQLSAPLASTSEPQLDLEEPKNQEIAPNQAELDSAAAHKTRPLPPPPPPAFRTTPETTSKLPAAAPGVGQCSGCSSRRVRGGGAATR